MARWPTINNATHKALVGEIGQGKSQQDLDRTHRPDNPLDEGPWHMAPCQGDASCLMPQYEDSLTAAR